MAHDKYMNPTFHSLRPRPSETTHEEPLETQGDAHEARAAAKPLGEPRDAAAAPTDRQAGDPGKTAGADRAADAAAATAKVYEDDAAGAREFVIKVGMNVRMWGDVKVEANTIQDAVDILKADPEMIADRIQSEVDTSTDDIDVYNATGVALLHASIADENHDFYDLDVELEEPQAQEPDPETLVAYLVKDVPDWVPLAVYEILAYGTIVELRAPVGLELVPLLNMPGVHEYLFAKAMQVKPQIKFKCARQIL